MPLTGLKVLDLTRVLAGPLCTMMLGDLGADVIKVERPTGGDESRGWGPPFDERGQSAYFLSVNRNKLSIALDFTRPEDRDVLLGLIRSADVVVDNFLPGVLARYGVDTVALMEECSRVVWCTISGFGPDSPRPGYDFVIQAESGWMSITGPEAGPPMKVGVALADVMTGKDAAIAILAALARREGASADKRRVSVSLAHSATAALVNVAQNVLVTGADARRWGNAHPNLVPYQLFEASDRPLVIAVGSDPQWLAMCSALDLAALAQDETLRTNAGRVAQRDYVVTSIAERAARQAATILLARLAHVGVPCGLVRTVQEAVSDVQSDIATGIAPALSGSIRRLPPLLDEHGVAIRKKQWSVFSMLPILGS
jgi:crotonobetainyl-CoA:carnitine CoA-transferase CaiB-like acyl-CoA transferase